MADTSPERWREIEALMDRVLDAPESERETILSDADPGVRREVERLISASDLAGDRFELPPLLVAKDVLLQSIDTARDQVEPGDVVGAYRVSRLLGRGGMGAVYEAERADGAFEKKVAIKIVKRGMDTDEIIRRFHHERRILARLEHPNIAGIVDGGITGDGLPYFVMELAQGQRIDEWCDHHTLLVRERLELFEKVCQAVQYAHGNLVIHRDIKPGNIVVADDGVKLLDFGIAKLVGPEDSAQVTQLNETRLTPQYAAPEQLRGEVATTSTDVYSLGVLLYELLCGRPPYRLQGRTLLEMEQIVCHVEPAAPSVAVTRWKDGALSADEVARRRGIGRAATLQLQLRGDLDAICMKALQKAPDQRYVSAAALAEDIRRHLDGRAVHAHPPTRGYRLRKFVQRNRRTVLLGAIAGLSMMVALVTAIVLGRQATRERDLRRTEAERATAARDFVLGTLLSFDPDERPGQPEFSAHDLVLHGLENLNALDVQPPLKASVMNTLAQVAFNLGERATADSLFHAAHEILAANGGGLDLAISKHGIGQVLQHDRRFTEAADWYRSALDLRRELGASARSVAESQQALAFASYNAGEEENLAEAERLYEDLLTWPDSLPFVRAGALEGLADVSLERGQYDRADSLYAESLAIRRSLQPDNHPDIARASMGVVAVRLGQGMPQAAERLSREIIRTLEDTYGSLHRNLVFGYRFLGSALLAQQDHERAAAAFRRAAAISDSVNLPGHIDTAQSWRWLATVRLAQGRTEEALSALRRVRDIYGTGRRTFDAGVGNEIALVDTILARLLVERGETDEAMALLRESGELSTDTTLTARVEAWLRELGESATSTGPERSRDPG